MWHHTGRQRPDFAVAPGAGQESVWDYPRPPRVMADTREVVISVDGLEIARTRRALRVLETASPPTFYLPRDDIDMNRVDDAEGSSYCEWKGMARYGSVRGRDRLLPRVAWWYAEPQRGFGLLRGHVGFYPAPLDCCVDGMKVLPQPGRFYAGWVTPEVLGPFKGAPGTEGW